MPHTTRSRYVVNRLGRAIHVLEGDPRGDALIAAGGDFNPPSLEMWQRLVEGEQWDLVVDVGANYGEMLLGVDLPRSAQVLAFEPDERVRQCLERSLAEAGLAVQVRPEAVSDALGSVDFLVDPWSGRSRITGEEERSSGAVGRVGSITLDSVLLSFDARSACLKVDVEGAEDLVLRGAEMTVRRMDRVAVLIEILHRHPEELVAWATAWQMYLYDLRAKAFVRVGRRGADDVRHLLQQSWIYRQDAVLRPRAVV